ncbi:MAG: ABC transporter permease [Rhodospirillales bacterium]|nr:ABC transporter permease [Rhodospirillales bacterium]
MTEAAITQAQGAVKFSREWFAQRKVVSSLSVAAFLIIWELAPRLGLVDPSLISQPSRVYTAALEIIATDDLARHTYVSLMEFSLGFGFAVLFGVPFGFLLGASKRMRYFIDPPMMALYATPRLTLLPIITLWLGIGMESKVIVVFIGSFIPIVINSVAGIRGVDHSLTRLADSFCATRNDIFLKVLLPGSLPAVMMGLRLGLGRGLLGVVVAEMFVAQEGIGYQIVLYGSSFRVDHLLFYTLLVSFFGFAVTTLIRKIEERLDSWRTASQWGGGV